ncbi:MAG: hypothetical protein P8J51_02345 [Dehalococcoidia bacterium]|nr:hypothetical protein [Dehalococcoidia bacterium]
MLEAIRELIFIIVGSLLIIALTIMTITILSIWILIRKTKQAFKVTMDETVNPVLHELQETAQNVKGTSHFMSKKTISPVIQFLSIIKGINKAIGFIGSIGRKK